MSDFWNSFKSGFRRTARVLKADGRTGEAFSDAGRSIGSAVRVVVNVLVSIVLIIVTTAAIMGVMMSIYITKYMQMDIGVNIDDFTLKQTSIIYAVDSGTGAEIELDTLHAEENRIEVSYRDIPQHLINATIAIEDQRFRSHQGVDWKRTARAVLEMLTGSGGSGGSTLTQQLIKNLTNNKEETVQRKMQEIFQALEFEKHNTKETILEWYLNTVYMGQGCYGVQTAALTYFNKNVWELSLAESAAIIGITNAPTAYDPFQNPEKNKKRQSLILGKMYDLNMISELEYNNAIEEELHFTHAYRRETGGVMSYYVDEVFKNVAADLVSEKGISLVTANQLLRNGGYRIYAAMDPKIQQIVDDVYGNEENYPVTKGSEKPQSAFVIMDPNDGRVLAMAGGRGEKTGSLSFNRATKMARQSGSAIKPVSVYAPSLDIGMYNIYSVVDDAPSVSNEKAWPRNSNNRYKGRVTLLNALTNSTNTIAVHLVEKLTPERSFEYATGNFGLTTLIASREYTDKNGAVRVQTDIDRAPMALGGQSVGVSVKEITAAYAPFVNRGIYTEPRTYTVVYDYNGEIVLDNRPDQSVAIKEKTAYYMTVGLQSVVQSGTGTAAKMEGMPVAGKTGTTSDDFDRWFVGYTPYYVAGCWFGFEFNKKISLEQSQNPALTMWKLIMERVHEGLERREFFEPEGLDSFVYCLDSGLLATDLCRADPRGSRASKGTLLKEDIPQAYCNVHKAVEVCVESNHPATPYCTNTKTVGMMDLQRWLPVSGVYLEDEQYTMRVWGAAARVSSDGQYPPVNGGTGGAAPYNTFCQMHATAPIATETPPPVTVTEPPDTQNTPEPTLPPPVTATEPPEELPDGEPT